MIKLFFTQKQYRVNIFIFEYIFTIIFNSTIFCFYKKLLSSFYHTRRQTKKKILSFLKSIFQREIEKSLFCSHRPQWLLKLVKKEGENLLLVDGCDVFKI